MERINKRPFVIGVSGGTCAGKTSVCQKIVELLENSFTAEWHPQVAIVRQESFFKSLTNKEKILVAKECYNFDHPEAYDTELMKTILTDIIERKEVRVPKYNFTNCDRKNSYIVLPPCDVLLIEGILIFYHEKIRDLFNMKLFVDSDADTRLSRRVIRDVERGKTLESILNQYTTTVKPAFEEFCLPSKKYADIIIPRGADNKVAINLIVQHIQDFLKGDLVARHSSSKSESIKSFKKTRMGRPH